MSEPAASPDRGNGREGCDLLVSNAVLVTMDAQRRVFDRGAVAIRARSIVGVGAEREILSRYRAARVLDAGGATVHPGFVDAHIHIVHGTARGVFADVVAAARQRVNFADWKAGVRPEDEHAATAFAGLELLRGGFTAFVEPGTVFDTAAVAEAAEAVGVRALLAGTYLWDRPETLKRFPALESRALYERAPPSTERCLDQLGAELHRNRDPDALVRGYVCLYGLGTASDEVLRAAHALAGEHGVAFQQHEGYEPRMSEADAARLGRSRMAHLDELGVLGERSTLVHVNVLDDEDAERLVRSRASVVWCPVAYLKLGIADTVRCRMPELHRRRTNVALGVDGTADCGVGDTGLAAHLVAKSAGDFVSAGTILEMKTIAAAKAAGIDDLAGSLEPGKRADLVIRSLDAPAAWPGVNVAHHLALLAGPGTVDTVIVDGAIVLRRGHSTRVDEGAIFAQARASVLRRLKRLDLTPAVEWPVLS